MKKRQFERIARKLVPEMPGFVARGWTIYHTPVDHLMRGFCCDDSGFNPTLFTVWVFALPLYVPTDGIGLSFGRRLTGDNGAEKWWDVSEADTESNLLRSIKSEGFAFLDKLCNPRDLVAYIKRSPACNTLRYLEALSLSYAVLDEYTNAIECIEELNARLNPEVGWQFELKERGEKLADLLRTDPEAAKRQLWEWEMDSKKTLEILTDSDL